MSWLSEFRWIYRFTPTHFSVHTAEVAAVLGHPVEAAFVVLAWRGPERYTVYDVTDYLSDALLIAAEANAERRNAFSR